MLKIKNPIFSIILYGIIFLLVFVAFFYNSNYFLSVFFLYRTSLPLFYHILLISGQVFCVIAAILLFIFRRKIYAKRKEFALLLITITIFFLIIELGSRIYICNFSDSDTASRILFPGQCGLKPKYEPHHYLNYHGTPNYISLDGLNIHNSMGFRGPEIIMPKPSGVYRIVTLGGSSTYTANIKDWKKDFARQLEKELKKKFNYDRIEVINAGLGGWNSWESLINLQINVLDIEPDLIIIYQGTNDVHTRLVNPPYYKGDNSGRRKQWMEPSIPIFFYSTFFRLVTGINPLSGLERFVNAPTTPSPTELTGFVKQLNGTPMETLLKNKPIYFERNLRNMIAIANEYNISVLLSTWAHTNPLNDYTTTPHYELGFKENNEVVEKVGKAHGVSVYDFASEMPNNKEFWSDGRHVNEKGAELKGKLFANYIYKNDMLKKDILDMKNGKK